MSFDVFEICGRSIPFSKIMDFQIIQCEYIYRPSYTSQKRTSLFRGSTERFCFSEMIPYAAIYDESNFRSSTAASRTSHLKDAIIKDAAIGAMSAISMVAVKLKIKPNRKRYKCINIAGRKFETYLDDIPAVIIRDDGKISEVFKDDELCSLLGESIVPVIYIIPALRINDMIFYGNGIQLDDVESEYLRLKTEYDVFISVQSSRIQSELELKKQKSFIRRISHRKKINSDTAHNVSQLLPESINDKNDSDC